MVGDILQPTHLLFVLIVALLVLGPKRLPEAGKALGKGLRDFRMAMSGEGPEHHGEIVSNMAAASAAPTVAAPAPVVATPAPVEPTLAEPTFAPAEPTLAEPTPAEPTLAPAEPAGSTAEAAGTEQPSAEVEAETTAEPAEHAHSIS
jgi:sec-independent protein translocase protein TatA